MRSFILAILISCLVIVFGEKARFDNYRVYSVNIENLAQLKVLNDLEAYPDGILFLDSPTIVDQKATLIIPPHKYADIAELFETYQIENHVRTHNLQKWAGKHD